MVMRIRVMTVGEDKGGGGNEVEGNGGDGG